MAFALGRSPEHVFVDVRALSSNASHYGEMTTRHSSMDDPTMPHSDFGTNVGEKILEQPEARHVIEAANWRLDTGTCNVGRTEQKIRLIAGTALLAAAASPRISPGWRIAMGLLGAMEIVTGSTRQCPVWSALGVSTARPGEC